MTVFSIIRIISHRFYVDKKSESVIGHKIIIICDLMIHLGLAANFKHQVIHWDDAAVPINESRSLLGQSYLTRCNMFEVEMQTTETSSTREATEILVKFLNITYVKMDLEQVAAHAVNKNAEDSTKLIGLFKYFEDLFYGTIV